MEECAADHWLAVEDRTRRLGVQERWKAGSCRMVRYEASVIRDLDHSCSPSWNRVMCGVEHECHNMAEEAVDHSPELYRVSQGSRLEGQGRYNLADHHKSHDEPRENP